MTPQVASQQGWSDCLRIQVVQSYQGFKLDVDLKIPMRGVTVLFGASGCGKTTCLRALAGLNRFDSANISFGKEVWQNADDFVPVHQRDIGYIFQEPALFAHLSVRDNLRFGMKRIAKSEHRVDIDELLVLLNVSHLLDRRPSGLSGGEKQRVAIARALLTSPRVLLMDEPLSALDSRIKQEILPYLERLHQYLQIPIVYVTHSVEELTRLADHLVLLNEGSVMAQGDPATLIMSAKYQSIFGQSAGVLLNVCQAQELSDGLTKVWCGDDPQNTVALWLVDDRGLTQEPACRADRLSQDRYRCRILATDVSIALEKPKKSSIINLLPAQIIAINDVNNGNDTTQEQETVSRGVAEVLLTLELTNGDALLAQITAASLRRLSLQVGNNIWAQIKAVAVL
ncbi:molybdenum ABC transporter ATP-binding protein [Vibrio sp. 10N.286.49.B3]|nr:molybdenum ABC transporter ATP-binding protein [Vibrio sp. 10N.286.49.B3]